ncbi:early nodulin-like protein 1 [Ananas comosus]|uniref:Early nodulin-like protein 1 n=1 Tax=Ananas comosus TaxID=4615 RepID=A0A6P5FQ74_ANACO|nr:early nodulin-like protein 1 [Ananas comosus]
MEPSRSCSVPALLLSLLTLATLMASPSAYVFYVGGRDGWVPNPSESYAAWSSRNRFQVNDTLVFKYNKSVDSVLVVGAAAYGACNVSGPVQRMDTGDDAFRLDRSGPFYFISGSSDRCANGEKLLVVVLAVRNKPPPPSTPAAPVTSRPSPIRYLHRHNFPGTRPPAQLRRRRSPRRLRPLRRRAECGGTPTAPSSGGGGASPPASSSPPSPPSSSASPGLKASGIEIASVVSLLSMVIFLS